MRTKSPTPTQDQVRKLFDYDEKTGVLHRRVKSRSWNKDGRQRIHDLGYIMISVEGFRYNVGQIAWLYVHGEWPKRLTYLNSVRHDNRIANLAVTVRDRDEVSGTPLTQDRLKEILHYDPETGWFTWREKSSAANLGERAGGLHGFGYRQIGLDYNKYLEHQLAWLYMTGEWPEQDIDHINNKRDDNRWCNLREATKSENGHNKDLHPRSTSGFPGVSRHGSRYRATITLNNKTRHIGLFGSIAETRVARLLAEIELFGRCTTFREDRDSSLPEFDDNVVRIELSSTTTKDGNRIDCLSVYNHRGVPFWIKDVSDIAGIIGARMEHDEESQGARDEAATLLRQCNDVIEAKSLRDDGKLN